MSSRSWLIAVQNVLVFIVLCSSFADIGVDAGPNADRLLAHLFGGRDTNLVHSFPVENDFDKVNVSCYFQLQEIIDLDMKDELFRVTMMTHMMWQDSRLAWNLSDYEGVFVLVVPDTMIWTPNLVHQNGVAGPGSKVAYSKLRVFSDGLIEWIRIGQMTSTCDVEIKWFPFDEQTCDIKFLSLDFENSVTLVNSDYNTTLGEHEGEWFILDEGVETTDEDSKFNRGWTNRIVRYKVRMRRQAQYYVVNLILPCALISCIAIAAFILPPDEGDKIALTITVLLTLTVYMMMVADKIPPTPGAIPIIDVYLMSLMVLSTVSVIASVFVISVHRRADHERYKMPNWVRVVFCKWLARFLCIKTHHLREAGETNNQTANEASEEQRAEEWKQVAMVIDRLCLLVFSLCFIIATIVIFTWIPE